MQWMPAGDHGILIDFSQGPFASQGDLARQIYHIFDEIRTQPAATHWNIVPSYATLMISYDSHQVLSDVLAIVADAVHDPQAPWPSRSFLIPFCAAGSMAPDLSRVANTAGLTPAEVITLFTAQPYRVEAIGFSPGFPYLSGLPAQLATSRLDTPRPRVPAGSVAIGGGQAGIYPLSTPGGWNLVGQTPLTLFDPSQTPPVVYRPGDFLQFIAVSREDFDSLLRQANHQPLRMVVP